MDYKERIQQLRQALTETVRLGIANPDLFAQQTTQLLNSMEQVKINAGREIERLHEKLGEAQGQIVAADYLQNQLIEIVSAFNRLELKRRDEEARLEQERCEHASPPPSPVPQAQESHGPDVAVIPPASEPTPGDRTVTPRGKRRGTR